MASGVKVDGECVEAYNIFKLNRKKPDALSFIIFGFNENNTKIIVHHKEPAKPPIDDSLKAKNADWTKMVDMLPDNDVRYAVVDIHFNSENGPRTEMLFLSWAPETTPIKKRMLVASSKEALKNQLIGVKNNVQANSYPDLDLRSVVGNLKGSID